MRLVLMRHGQSEWNLENLFTGWYDCDLTRLGEDEARDGGAMLRQAGILPDVVHTSVQLRAIRTANLALGAAGRHWVPVRRSWRLNERHYGALQGLDKQVAKGEFGADQLLAWRRSYDVPPPPVASDSEHHPSNDERYRNVPAELLPSGECLKDVLERVLPYFFDSV